MQKLLANKKYNKYHGVIKNIRGYILDIDMILPDGNSVVITLDARGYQGKRPDKIIVGARVKFYSRPQDRRPFVYKLIGE